MAAPEALRMVIRPRVTAVTEVLAGADREVALVSRAEWAGPARPAGRPKAAVSTTMEPSPLVRSRFATRKLRAGLVGLVEPVASPAVADMEAAGPAAAQEVRAEVVAMAARPAPPARAQRAQQAAVAETARPAASLKGVESRIMSLPGS